MEDVFHTDAFLECAELNLDNAFADPPVGDERTGIVELFEIGLDAEVAGHRHGADTEGGRRKRRV